MSVSAGPDDFWWTRNPQILFAGYKFNTVLSLSDSVAIPGRQGVSLVAGKSKNMSLFVLLCLVSIFQELMLSVLSYGPSINEFTGSDLVGFVPKYPILTPSFPFACSSIHSPSFTTLHFLTFCAAPAWESEIKITPPHYAILQRSLPGGHSHLATSRRARNESGQTPGASGACKCGGGCEN